MYLCHEYTDVFFLFFYSEAFKNNVTVSIYTSEGSLDPKETTILFIYFFQACDIHNFEEMLGPLLHSSLLYCNTRA